MKNQLRNQMIFGFTTLVAIIILILSVIFSYNFENLSRKEIYKNATINIIQTSNTVEFLSQYVNGILLKMSSDRDVTKLFQSENCDYTELMKSRKNLDSIRFINDQIHSIYIYDESEDLIFESSANHQAFTNRINTFYDEDFVELLSNIQNYKRYTPVLRTIPVFSLNNLDSMKNVFTYMFFDSYSSKKCNVIAVNISMEWLSDALGYFQGHNTDLQNILIVNENGYVVFSPDKNQINELYEDTEILNEIATLKKNSGYFVAENKENSRLVTYVKSTKNGYEDWIFISARDYQEVTASIHKIKMVLYGVSGMILLIAIIGFTVLSFYFYNPVKSAIAKAERLEREQEKTKLRENQRYLKQLLEGEIVEEMRVINDELHERKIEFDFAREFQLVLVSFNSMDSLKRKYRKEYWQKIKEAHRYIDSVFKEMYENYIKVEWDDATSVFVIHVQEENYKADDNKTELIFNLISKELNDRMEGSVNMAISSSGDSFKDLPYLLAEALDIQTYRYLYGTAILLTPDKIKASEVEEYEYPKGHEKKILTNLFSGKLEETSKAYDEFVDYLIMMPIPEIKISFLQLAYAIKYTSKNTTSEVSKILINFEQFLKKIQSLETIFEVNHMFLNIFKEIGESIERQQRGKYDNLIDFVKQQTESGYSQVNFSIKDVADNVDMSTAYLGRLFKQQTGIPFTEYLAKYRIDIACMMLLETEKTINEISEECGFANNTYFYLVFKKYLNCTPTQYRNMNVTGSNLEKEDMKL